MQHTHFEIWAVAVAVWAAAAKLWREVAKEGDPKLRAKAKFNLALFNEVEGRLKKGFEWAQEAAVDWPKARTRDYVSVLSRRMDDERRLAEQMKEATKPAKPAKDKLAVPAQDDGTMTRPEADDGTMTRPEADDGTMKRPESGDGTMKRPE